MVYKKLLSLNLAMLILFLGAFLWVVTALAFSVGYKITVSDTPTTVDSANTTAVVDTASNEIRLPKYAPKVAAFWGDEYLDYIVLTPEGVTHYSFDGTQMVANPVVSVSGIGNPLAAFTSSEYPDVIVADGSRNQVTHYSFTGSEMVENPALSVAGLTGVVAVGSRNVDLAALAGGKIEYYGWDGSGMVNIPALSVETGLTNPIDFALFPDNYDMVVLDGNQARYYSAGTENPALAITGLSAPKSIAAADGGNIAVIDGNQLKHYTLTESGFAYNSALSVTSGLTAPTCVALRPGTYDRLIVDGNQVKYYSWDGSELVYNPQLSVTVAGLQNMGSYAPVAVVQSVPANPGVSVSYVRVRAYHVLPEGTSVTWSVTADGINWVKKWRVRGLSGGVTVCEVSNNNGTTWDSIGDESKAWPSGNTMELWAKVVSGNSVEWKAELATSNPQVTPKIKAPVPGTDAAVLLDCGNPPQKPVIPEQGSCYLTTTPTFTWNFNDPDPGDMQTGYEAEITKADGTTIYKSGMVLSSSNSFTVPTSADPALPGPLWASGDYQFKVRVRVFDLLGIPSDWSDPAGFCVIAFERPRVCELAVPAANQTAPDPANPATHILITQGMLADQLPAAKAGSKVGILLDSVGPVTSLTATFPYRSAYATLAGSPAVQTANGVNKTWLIEFWTDANLEVCPDGTVVEAQFSGNGTSLNLPPYAAGVVRTNGTVYSSWFVVLEGRKQAVYNFCR